MKRGAISLVLAGVLSLAGALSAPPGHSERHARFAIHLVEEEFTGQFPTSLRLEGAGICPHPVVRVGVPGFGLLEASVLESTDGFVRVGLFGDDFAPYTAAVVVRCPGATRTFYATLGLAGFGA